MQAWARRSFKLFFYYLPLLKSMIYLIYNGHISRFVIGYRMERNQTSPERHQTISRPVTGTGIRPGIPGISTDSRFVFLERNQTNSERNQTSQVARDFCLFWLFCLLGVESNQLREESNLSYGQTHVRGQYRAHMELAIMTSSISFMQGGRYSAF